MRNRLVAGFLSVLLVPLSRGPTRPLPVRQSTASLHRQAFTPQDSALHALNRLAYGPRPGESDRVAAIGVMRWIDRQLDPAHLDDAALGAREHQFTILTYDQRALAQVFLAAQRERRERTRTEPRAAESMGARDNPGPKARLGRRLAGDVADLVVVRAALSERQLAEVMADFWANHFNVFFGKGFDRFLLPDYIEHTIRPHALDRFGDLLRATAQSPAMLVYLDNWQSVAPGSKPRRARASRPGGINENYARELLELHTLGVDGGYTQQDVINVARIFTGWSIRRPQRGGEFNFYDRAHDRGEKIVMGVTYPAGGGMDEGFRLLAWLAENPATARHVSHQLCQRFVNDQPPDGCVDDAVVAWQRTHGDIREVLRAIFHGPDFWAPENVRTKVKSPLEFVVSAVRALQADPDTTPRLAQVVARLGQPLYLHVAPDGYPERQDDWVNSGALLNRMNAGIALAAGKLPGAIVDLDLAVPATSNRELLIAAVDEQILGGAMTESTRRVIREQLHDLDDPVQARALAIGLALGGPEFQRQ
jgi:uncharacterized protein (DUF1800 family)